ncbi:unnamed protein product [Ixodes pacificus]
MTEDQVSLAPDSQHDSKSTTNGRKYAEGAFLAAVAGSAALFGFGMTIAMAKKRDPEMFTQGLLSSKQIPESGSSLALRALGRGTLYSVAGFSLFCLVVWKAMGVKSVTWPFLLFLPKNNLLLLKELVPPIRQRLGSKISWKKTRRKRVPIERGGEELLCINLGAKDKLQ